MALRKFNPITPGMRHKVLSKFEEITTDKPHKPLLEPIKKSGGRNSDGKMTMRLPRWGTQASLPRDRLQAQQAHGGDRVDGNTIQTAQATFAWWNTRTARSVTSSRLKA